MTPELRRQSEQAVQVVTAAGARLSGGRAVIFVLKEIGWHPCLMRLLAYPPFMWAIELGYRIVAANRSFFARILFR